MARWLYAAAFFIASAIALPLAAGAQTPPPSSATYAYAPPNSKVDWTAPAQTLNAACGTPVSQNCPVGSVAGIILPGNMLVYATVAGSFSGNIVVEGAYDCLNFGTIPVLSSPFASTPITPPITSTGTYQGQSLGYNCYQYRMTSYGTGAATVIFHVSPVVGAVGGPASGSSVFAPSWNTNVTPADTTCVSPAVCTYKQGSGTLHEIISLTVAGATQPAGNCIWYDNASAASGKILYAESGFGAGQYVVLDENVSFGVTVQCAAAPGGFGLMTLTL